MKLLIDIPKKDYDKMCKGELVDTILVAIKNGILLPKGYGRLGDLDELLNSMKREVKQNDANEYDCLHLVKQAQTLIEAESEI